MKDYRSNQGLDELRAVCGLEAKKPQKEKVICLRCTKSFLSEDKRLFRICNHCKRDSIWQGSRESDVIYPAIPKNMGYTYQGPKASSKGPRKKGLAMGRSLSRKKKHFGKRPLAKKRTRS